jgi:DNA repair protein RecN (Recombination protein N)
LPQIAGLADHHLAVDKAVSDGRTVVSARLLTAAERVPELARMLGAADDDPAAREHAARLLGQAPASAKRSRAAVGLPHKGRSHD